MIMTGMLVCLPDRHADQERHDRHDSA